MKEKIKSTLWFILALIVICILIMIMVTSSGDRPDFIDDPHEAIRIR